MPKASRYSKCPGCRRPVLRLVHAVTGRVGLLERQPHREGTFRVQMLDERVLAGTYTTARGEVDPGERLYRSHFASCPVDRRLARPKPRPGEQAQEPAVHERCCHACGYRLHDDLFGPGMPPVYSELHPLCIPDDRLPELDGLSCATARTPVPA